MASLSKSTQNARKFMLLGLVGLAAVLLVDLLGRYVQSVQPLPAIATCYPIANNSLGVAGAINIPSISLAQGSQPTFALNGRFGTFPPTAFVYGVEQPRVALDTLPKAEATAQSIGFTTSTSRNNVLSWQNASRTRALEFNSVSGKWQLRTQYFFDPVAQRTKQLNQTASFYENRAGTLLGRFGFNDFTFERPISVATFAALQPSGEFINPLNPSSAEYVVLDIYRNLSAANVRSSTQLSEAQRTACKDQPSYQGKVYTADPRVGSLHLVVTNQVQTPADDVMAMDFINYKYSLNAGVYNIVTVEEAYSRLQLGEGKLVLSQLSEDDYFASSKPLNVRRFVINAVQTELAYFEPSEYSPMIMPIYVFRGSLETSDGKSGRFVFYVDALQRLNITNN